VEFVCGVGVPDDEFAVLGGGDEVPSVSGPVHGVYFGEMAFESATGFHGNSR